MYLEHLSCIEDVLPPAKSSLREKMEKALSLLEDSLGSRCFPVQTFLFGYVIMDFQNGLQIFVIYRPNECLYLSDAISCGVGGIIALPPVFESDQPKYCCAVLEFVTKEEKHDFECLYLSDAISCGVGGIIALPPVFESDQPKYCCAVLEFVTKEEKHDFDLEMEKVFQASRCYKLCISPTISRLPIYGSIYNLDFVLRDQRAELTEIANVTRAVCLTHRLPLALTWIPCDYTWGAVDDISKSHCRLCNSDFLRTCELSIERIASYSDEEMQGFVNACEQLFLNTGQGAAGQAHRTYLPSFEPDVKEKHVSEYPLAHHVRKYNLNAAVAIVPRSTGAGCSYILEFFLPHDRYFRATRFGYNPED
ncbi:hypothetical protein NC653_037415 [Populus alba x Populus x berolinensis]|uniref:NLP1-9 GAF domain-containing protein n=1 Tax=Populus alba x Populus x berolinensis TaxID=444605 RepID=A0AAD6PRY0_9ROSI|nr:hypothetical protein NC653_037415 [Populus alba x Populus x berolinensis]